MTRLTLTAGSYLAALSGSAVLFRLNAPVEPTQKPFTVSAGVSRSTAPNVLKECQGLTPLLHKAASQITPHDFYKGIDIFKKNPTQAAKWLAAEVRAPTEFKSLIAQWIGAVATSEDPISSYEEVKAILENAWGKDHAVLQDAEAVFLSQLIQMNPRLALGLPNGAAGMSNEWRTSARIRMISLYGPSASSLSASEITANHMGSLSDLLMRWPEGMTAALTGEDDTSGRQEFFRKFLANKGNFIDDTILIPIAKACGLSASVDAVMASPCRDPAEQSALMDIISRIRAALGDGVAKHMLAQRFKSDPVLVWTLDYNKTQNMKLASEALSESIRDVSGFALALLTAGHEFGAQQEKKAALMGECAAALSADELSEANLAALGKWSPDKQNLFWSEVFKNTKADVEGILNLVSPESKTTAVLSGLSRSDASFDTAAIFLNAVVRNPVAPEPNDAAKLGEKLAHYYPAETASWAVTLDGEQQKAAVTGVIRSWAEADAATASDWVDKLTKGPVKDAAVAALAPAIIWDFSSAITWAGTIEEPELRDKTFQQVLQGRQDAYGDADNLSIPENLAGRFKIQ
jgi:hypothetical protein